jgi:acyl-coenzyme A synthetase/AMP-(fatty) acid ligase
MGTAICSIYSGSTIVVPAIGPRPTPETLAILLQFGKCTAVASPPSFLEAAVSHPEAMEELAKLKHVAYSGGPLNKSRGEVLSQRLRHLYPILASTEGGIGHFISSGDSSRWNTFKFVDLGQRMEEIGDGVYELVYPRTALVNRTRAFFHTKPSLGMEFRTSDLFSPVAPDYWIYRGRADNLIAMPNGLNIDPTEAEDAIAAHPDVTGALVVGSARPRVCLLVELREGLFDDPNRVLETLWPMVNQANLKTAKFAKIPKDLILISHPTKRFIRTAKGTI